MTKVRIKAPVYKDGGKVISPEDAAISKVLMERNRGKNFVDRAYDPNRQSIQVPGQKGRSTHLMGYEFTDDQNSANVYPQVVESQPGQLQYLGGQGYDHALQTGQYINVPMNKAAMFSDYGYKHASGMYKQQYGGQAMNTRKVRVIPPMQSGGQTYRQDQLPTSGPGYTDYGPMYSLPNMGLFEHMPNVSGMGNNQNLMSTDYSGFNGANDTGTGYDQLTQNLNMNPSDYSVDNVRSQQYGGNTKRVKLTPPMKYGGHRPGDTFAFDDSWNPNSYQGMSGVNPDPNPYTHTSNTLPEDPNGDVIVEKQEQVLGQFTPDGLPSLMGVNTGSHASGNDQQISVPDKAFIYSDTKDLKIKDLQILKHFGQSKSKTPAQIAKNYRLQKYTKVLADPDSDQVSRKTAEMMVANMSEKLDQLATVQENMKGNMGLDNNQQRPMAKTGGQWEWDSVMPKQVPDDYTVTAKRPTDIAGKMYGPKLMDTEHEQLPMLPTTVPQPTNMQQVPNPDNGFGSTTGNTASAPRFTSSTPSKLGVLNSLYNVATIHKYPAYEAPINAVVPDTVYMDPTRALAANAEAANSQSYNNALSANSRAARASSAGVQGQAASNAANILSQYSNANAEIANKSNEQAANISNKLQELQAARSNRLYQGTVTAAQQYDNATREGRDDLTQQLQGAWKDRQGYDLMNKTSPYFYIDPVSGARAFKSKEAEARFNNEITKGSPTPDSNTYAILASEYKKAKDAGLEDEDAKDAAWKTVYGERTRTSYDKSGRVKGSVTTGPTKHKMGGFTNYQLQKFITNSYSK